MLFTNNHQFKTQKMTFQQQRDFPHFFHPNGYYYDDESRYTATICAEWVLDDHKPRSKKLLWNRAERNNLIVEKLKTNEEYQAKWWYYYNFYTAYIYIFGRSFYGSSPRYAASKAVFPRNQGNFQNQLCHPYPHGECRLGQKCHFLHDNDVRWR